MRGRVGNRHGRWFYVVDVGLKPDGSRRQEQRTYDTEAEAYAALAKRNQELEQGESTAIRPDSLAAYLHEWVGHLAGVRAVTLHVYSRDIEHWIIPYLGSLRVRNLKPRDIRRWHDLLLGRGLSSSSIRRAHTILSRALSDAVNMEELPRNVAKQVRPPAQERSESNYWTPEQAVQFILGTAGHEWAAPFVLMLGTGIRIGECLALTWDDLDLQAGWLSVRRTMTKTATGKRIIGDSVKSSAGQRRIKLDPGTTDEMRRHRDRCAFRGGSVLCFQGEVVDMPLTPQSLGRRFSILCELAGVGGISIHGLRHTHATLLLSRGVSAKTVSMRLGHSSTSFTLDRYGHVLDSMQEEAAEAVGLVLRR